MSERGKAQGGTLVRPSTIKPLPLQQPHANGNAPVGGTIVHVRCGCGTASTARSYWARRGTRTLWEGPIPTTVGFCASSLRHAQPQTKHAGILKKCLAYSIEDLERLPGHDHLTRITVADNTRSKRREVASDLLSLWMISTHIHRNPRVHRWQSALRDVPRPA